MTLKQLGKNLSDQHGCYVHATEQRHRVLVDNILIQADDQDKGKGTAIIREFIKWAFEHNHVAIELVAVPDEGREDDLIRWYESFGFKRKMDRNRPTMIMTLIPSMAKNMGEIRLIEARKLK